MSDQLKDMFNAARYRGLADELAALSPSFDRKRFLDHTLDGLASRELMDRMRRTSTGVALALPLSYPKQLDVLRALAPRLHHGFVSIFLSDFVAQHGLASADIDVSLDALKTFTRFGSAEFAIRPFIERDPNHVLAVMREWSLDSDEHVRRLASEGSRPRLPWGSRLAFLVADPSPTLPILETLRADPSLYVRKSVANHLNDIAKDHPHIVLALLKTWDAGNLHTAWIIRHALRTLIKAGHPHALALIGAGSAARLDVDRFQAAPRKLTLGDAITLNATFTSRAAKPQRLVIDYIVHYARTTRGGRKVFKWKTLDLLPRSSLTLTKRQTIRDFSTRRHHAGLHKIELQINGRILAETSFTLSLA